MEDHDAIAAQRNNTLGTWHAALVAVEACAERFLLISTDKAVNPTDMLGATRRAAEMAVGSPAATHPAHVSWPCASALCWAPATA